MRRIMVALFLLGCITASALNFDAGETLTFQVKYGMVSAGEATLSIQPYSYNDSIPAYQIQSVAKTNKFFDSVFKVRDKIESVWDADKLVSLRFTKRLREGKYWQKRTHYYYPATNITIYTRQNRKTKQWKTTTMDIPPHTQDILTAFYWTRTQSLAVGDSILINITVDGHTTVAKVIVHETEELDTIFGKKSCVKIEPLLVGESLFKQTGAIYIWLTNDENKIPVLLESKIVFGHFRAILTNAK